MRPGIVGLLPRNPTDLDDLGARSVREAGFIGASVVWRFAEPPDRNAFERLRGTLDNAGLAAAQLNASYPDLVSADDARRHAGLRRLAETCRWARWVGADNTYVRPGSLNPAGPWLPHPENRSAATFDRLVAGLREAATTAESEGVFLAVEGHVLSPLFSIERVRDLFDAVGSPALRFNADPVNFVGSLDDAYAGEAFVDRFFDVLGPWVLCAHVKDVRVADRLVLHVDECIPGDGLLDLATFCRRFEACCPDGFALIEHLPDEQIPRAKAGLDAALSAVGLNWSARNDDANEHRQVGLTG